MCAWKVAVIQQLTLVSVTNFPEGLYVRNHYQHGIGTQGVRGHAAVSGGGGSAGYEKRATQSVLDLQLPIRCSWGMKGRHAYNCARGNIANGSVNQSYFT